MEINYACKEYLNFLEGCYQHPVALVEISSICNFQCGYCVSRTNVRDKVLMSQDLFEHIVSQLPQITPYPVRLHVDGEPTIHPKFYEFGKLLNRLNIPFVLATNGSRLSRNILDLRMEVLVSISTNQEEFQSRASHMGYDHYLAAILDYLKDWLLCDSEQTIYIQIPYYGSLNDEVYSHQKNEFVKEVENQLNVGKYADKRGYSGLDTENCYVKPNGHLLCFYRWPINTSQIYRPVSEVDQRTSRGFCSLPWQELAILSDGRISFCCVDLTGGTAFTRKEDIWKYSLLELWRDGRIIRVRKDFMDHKVRLNACQRCLADIGDHERYANDHPFDTEFTPRSKELFPVDSMGGPRGEQRLRSDMSRIQVFFPRLRHYISKKGSRFLSIFER